jgi:hypothetical protein
MNNPKTPISEWDEAEQAEETSDRTFSEFLGHWVQRLWPILVLAVFMVGVGVWIDHHP